jgi:hypothetical protein
MLPTIKYYVNELQFVTGIWQFSSFVFLQTIYIPCFDIIYTMGGRISIYI